MVRGMSSEAGKKTVELIIDGIELEQAKKLAKRYKLKGEESKIYYPVGYQSQIDEAKAEENFRSIFR